MIGTTVSHYKILEKLGEGGMGVVYKAEDLKLTRTVALKFLPHGLDAHEPERARFLQEARAAAILNHPNICTVYDIQEHEGQQFIVMEYVEGKTLREIIPVKKMQDAITYGIQIAEALQEAHTKGIVHRDIKAENIMVNSKNQVKVMDFGLAKLKGSLKLTKTSSTVGTLAYMAPEQIQGGEVDARSDIFSFGVVLYEMLAGQPPFRGEHEAAIIYSILNQEPEPIQKYVPEAPLELPHLLSRALEKEPEDRYQTVGEMLIDLRRLKKDSSRVLRQPLQGTTSPGAALPGPPEPRHRVQKKWIWLGAAGVVVICALFAMLFLPRSSLVKLNPNRTMRVLPIPFARVFYPSLSRDGNWIVFPVADEHDRWDIYSMNTSSGEPARVTHEENYSTIAVSLSPDVGQIAYDRLRVPGQSRGVRLVPFQGGASRTVADTGMGAAWRPDGERIGYIRGGRIGSDAPSASGRLEIWSVKPDGTDNRLELIDTVASNYTRGPVSFCWSPDGASMVWVRTNQEGYSEVMVRDLATGRERQLTFDKKVVDEVFWTTNDRILFVSTRSGHTNLWVMPAGGGEAVQVTQGTVPLLSARISADNRKLVYLEMETIWHIWISALDGNAARQVTTDDVLVGGAKFSPDRNSIAAVIGDVDIFKRETYLYLMDRDGKNRRKLTSGSATITSCAWSLDGKWLAYTSCPLGQPADSSGVYLIQPFNPGGARLLCKAPAVLQWLDDDNVTVWKGMKTWKQPTKGGPATQMYEDSTEVSLILGKAQIIFHDYRRGREGFWTAPITPDGKGSGEPKKVLSSDVHAAAPADNRFLLYTKGVEKDLWRLWLPGGKEERLGKALPGQTRIADVSVDGKEILWAKTSSRSKLVLMENVFE
jgi:serine/threonine protein kinase